MKPSSSSNNFKLQYGNPTFNKTTPLTTFMNDLPILNKKKAKLYKPRSHIKICKTMTDLSSESSSNVRSKTLTKIHKYKGNNNFQKQKNNPKGPNLYNNINGYGYNLRSKSHAKKPIKFSSTSDLSKVLFNHTNNRNRH